MRGLAKLLLIRNAVICFILPACLLCIASEASTAVFDKYEYDVGVLEEGKSLNAAVIFQGNCRRKRRLNLTSSSNYG